ncbi:hypothetical protein SAMN05216466_10669 [Paraburkholderia phenazinium]|uniref:Uncharacterized protein n=1 Tax=Paraburkholderia phenazinium TaxID=60549 RepID=A0A1G7Y7H5_9BURK|nr:hypothetical protein [Paraburkholderia phenazinium]SDG92391.1 hypothetical protein SAMN05216466_10669 [Paraburkholderia phenazinium]
MSTALITTVAFNTADVNRAKLHWSGLVSRGFRVTIPALTRSKTVAAPVAARIAAPLFSRLLGKASTSRAVATVPATMTIDELVPGTGVTLTALTLMTSDKPAHIAFAPIFLRGEAEKLGVSDELFTEVVRCAIARVELKQLRARGTDPELARRKSFDPINFTFDTDDDGDGTVGTVNIATMSRLNAANV